VTDSTTTPAPSFGVWRRLWNFIQACDMSTAEYCDLRIAALERRVAELQKALQERAPGPSVALRDNSRDARSVVSAPGVRGPQEYRI
jgi:hypothetical protein